MRLSNKHLPPIVLCALSLVACGDDEPTPNAPAITEPTTYSVKIAQNSWYSPTGIGAEIGAYVPEFLFTVEPTTDALTGVFGTGDGAGTQERCNPTTPFTAASLAQVGPFSPKMYIRHTTEDVQVNTTVHDLTLKNVFADGANGEVSAVMDFTELAPMFTVLGSPTPDVLCATLERDYGVPCEPCPHDATQITCLTLLADQVGATVATAPVAAIESQPGDCPLNRP